MAPDQFNNHRKRKILDPYFYAICENYFHVIINPNMKDKTIKHLKENKEKNIFMTLEKQRFLEYTRGTDIREQLYCIKLNFWLSKDPIKRRKAKLREWEEISAIHISTDGLILHIWVHIKKLLQLCKKKTDHSIKNWAKDFIRHHTKEDIHMANSI